MVGSTSKSASSSPIAEKKRLVSTLSPSSISVTNSPRILHSNRYAMHKIFENELVKEEARRMLMDGQQKVIIIPMNKNGGGSGGLGSGGGGTNGRLTPQVKVCSANSSDSSEGKPTPPQPRSKRHVSHVQNGHLHHTNSFGGGIKPAAVSRQHGTWKPSLHGLRAPQNSPSLRSLKATEHNVLAASPSLRSFTYADVPATSLRPLSDVVSLRSLVSVGMGSTDGKKLVIRRVPTSPSDLLNFTHTSPCGVTGEDDFSSCGSYSGTFSDVNDSHKSRRRYWANKLQFVLACVGYSVGLGNLWRFPYLCYKSGGGVFLIPYFLILLLCSAPMLYMELAVGQFTRRGPIGALSKLCPIFKGVGLSSVVVSFFLSTYYNVIIAYMLFYFFTAFRDDPPWKQCSNRWNTPACWNRTENRPRPLVPKTPVEEFYIQKVLNSTSTLENFGAIRWDLVASSFIIWVVVYFALWKSVRSSGRILYFTATVPFVLVFGFLGYAVSLEGSGIGLKYLFSPKWELLLDSKVWIYAAAQNFHSIGLAFGSVISFASYNKYNNQILYDTITVTGVNAITSVLVAIFTFATIGKIAFDQKEEIDKVIADGPGLIFVVYPEALSQVPLSGLWTVLFFFTLLCLGMNSQFAIVEVVVTSLQDGFPSWVKKELICHEILVLAVCLISFVFGLPNVFQGGIYFFQLIDHYVASVSIIYIAFFEVIAVTWIYGSARLSRNVEQMTKRKPSFYFTYCWKVVTPVLLTCLWILSVVDYEPPTYEEYHYPLWAEIVGWIFLAATLISVPIFAAYVLLNAEGNNIYEKLKNSIKPRLEDCWCSHSGTLHESTKDMKELHALMKDAPENNNQRPKVPSITTMREEDEDSKSEPA